MRLKIALFIIALMIPVQVVAGSSSIGIGVSPGNMSFKLAPGTSVDQSLYVMNTGNETATYEIFVDSDIYDDWFTFSSTSFNLNAGEIREVKATLNVPATAETDVECKIKIPCTVSGKVVGTGVIIPVHIKISTSEISDSKEISSDGSSSRGSRSSPESYDSAKVKEISQQLVENASNLVVDSKKEVIHAGEKLKASAENLENTANQSIDNATVSLDKVTRKFENTGRKIEDKTKKYEDPNRIYEDTIQYIDNIIKVCLAKVLTYLSPGLAALQTDVCYDSIILM